MKIALVFYLRIIITPKIKRNQFKNIINSLKEGDGRVKNLCLKGKRVSTYIGQLSSVTPSLISTSLRFLFDRATWLSWIISKCPYRPNILPFETFRILGLSPMPYFTLTRLENLTKSFTQLVWMHFNHKNSKDSVPHSLFWIELTSQLSKMCLSLTSIPTT